MKPFKRKWRLELTHSWSSQLNDAINCIAVGKPFLEEMSEENDILIGTTSGRVLTMNQTKPVVDLLETKGGSIQTLNLQYLTGYRAKDLIVGDSDGVVTLFSKQQMLTKRSMGAPISQVDIHDNLGNINIYNWDIVYMNVCIINIATTDLFLFFIVFLLVGGYEIIVGDTSGVISSFQQHDLLWKFNLDEWSIKIATEGTKGRRSSSIRCIHSTKLRDLFGLEMSCLLITNGWPMIYFLQQGQCIQSLRTPSPIQSICSGNFLTLQSKSLILGEHINKSTKLTDNNEKLDNPQVLLAGQDGNIYVMMDFEVRY
ncbi:hypothetical protein BJ944DRAFT_94666 [Cunninghamella echinulata]|nr:hypothetical protein BJ944DRAFT_94666 [Cunninghamella echinulata]